MVYHLYIDVVFMINLLMNTTVLLIVKKLLNMRSPGFRIILGAGIGALWSCLIAVFPILPIPIEFLATCLGIGSLMVKTAFATKGWRSLAKGVLVLYLATVTLGGTMFALFRQGRLGYELLRMMSGLQTQSLPLVIFLLLTAGSILGGRYLWMTLLEVRRQRQNLYQVSLAFGNHILEVTGLLDTGNHLYEPVSRRPVHVVSQKVWDGFYEEGRPICMIPYHTIGTEEGMMQGMFLDSMEIKGEQEQRSIIKPLIAVSPHPLARDGEYEILLHEEN